MTASARSVAMILPFANVAIRAPHGTFETHEELRFPTEVTMKVFTVFAFFILSILVVSSTSRITSDVSAQDGKKPQETYTLAAEAKLGPVAFSHLNHITKNRSADGTKQI